MTIHALTPSRVADVATLMSTLKPEWWDFEGANQQLQDVQLLATLVGWDLESDGQPKGWIFCAEFPGYSTMTIENLGFDEAGTLVMEEPLEPLLQQAEEYARQKGYRNLKYVIGSTGMSCHGRPITDYAEELRTLRSNGWARFDFFRKIGFVPTGLIPNCYGENYHGIMQIRGYLPEAVQGVEWLSHGRQRLHALLPGLCQCG